MLQLNKKDAAVQQAATFQDVTFVTPTAPMSPEVHGGRAKCLQRLVRLDMPVPRTVALSFAAVGRLAKGQLPDIASILRHFEPGKLLLVRPSSQDPDWGGPSSVLNIGMNHERCAALEAEIGLAAATTLYAKFVRTYAIHVARLDPDAFEFPHLTGEHALQGALDAYEYEADERFPQDIEVQLSEVLRSMARAWDGTTARLLRTAKGAPADAGLGLVVQELAMGVGAGECGSGVSQYVDSNTGPPPVTGRYLRQSPSRTHI